MTRKIEVVSYNPAWPKAFEEEAARIKQVLDENCVAVHYEDPQSDRFLLE
jgi:GrpB-like predicted nucleotidyltransferase (UPF0157 family)